MATLIESLLARDKLPQIPTKEIPNFVRYCQGFGVPVKAVKLGVMKLRPIQKHLNKDKVRSMVRSSAPYNIPLMVSNDNRIMDGHHRWAAEAVKNRDSKVTCLRFGCNIARLVELGHTFDGSFRKGVAQ